MSTHEHSPHLQHHFDTEEQQFDAGKLGMWLFLATEILLFGGLFCAYAIYRGTHPEIFLYAHQFLDKTLGGTNTVILLCSSLTMAWAVRASQLGQRKLLITLLSLTLLGGFGFMGIKFVEYKAKWEHGLLPGRHFAPHEPGESNEGPAGETSAAPATAPSPPPSPPPSEATKTQPAQAPNNNPPAAAGGTTGAPATAPSPPPSPPPSTATNPQSASAPKNNPPAAASAASAAGPTVQPSAQGPSGTVRPDVAEKSSAGFHGKRPSNVQIFFGIYFLMTGLHGIHVLGGMGAITWLLIRSVKGHFGPDYYTPVDFVGLYWHLVDLIWIFLFPLLYLVS
jgi:cytochrome c oxidase subunit 3